MDLHPHDLLLRGVRVRYHEAGEGPALLLIHGFLTSHRTWGAVLPRLAERFRVIVPDLPGFGASERPAAYAYSREAFADTLCDLLAGLGIPRAHVCGHALGGGVALSLAADHPEHVERLAVLDAAAFPSVLPWVVRVPTLPVVGPFVFKQLYGRYVIESFFRDRVYARGALYDPSLVDAYFDAFDPPEARESAHQSLLASLDTAALGPKLSKIRAPLLVLWGDHDRLFPLSLAERLARAVPNARVELVSGAGHCPHEDHPEETAERLERFLLGAAP